MKIKILCDICNREFETEERQLEWDEVLEAYIPKEAIICPDCEGDRDI